MRIEKIISPRQSHETENMVSVGVENMSDHAMA